MGGIASAEDVLAFMMCGASAVQVGTANLSDPMAAKTIAENLTKCLDELKIERIADVVGTLQV